MFWTIITCFIICVETLNQYPEFFSWLEIGSKHGRCQNQTISFYKQTFSMLRACAHFNVKSRALLMFCLPKSLESVQDFWGT